MSTSVAAATPTPTSASEPALSARFAASGDARSEVFQLAVGHYELLLAIRGNYLQSARGNWKIELFRLRGNVLMLESSGRDVAIDTRSELLIEETSWNLWFRIDVEDGADWSVTLRRVGELPAPSPQPERTPQPTATPTPTPASTPQTFQSCQAVPESLIVVDTQGRRAVPRHLVPSAPDGDNDGFACGGQLGYAPTPTPTPTPQTYQSCQDVPESHIVVDTQGRRAVPRHLVPSAPDGDDDGFACGGQLGLAPTPTPVSADSRPSDPDARLSTLPEATPIPGGSRSTPTPQGSRATSIAGRGGARSEVFQLPVGLYEVRIDISGNDRRFAFDTWTIEFFRTPGSVLLLEEIGWGASDQWQGELLITDAVWSLWFSLDVDDKAVWSVTLTRVWAPSAPSFPPARTLQPTASPRPTPVPTPQVFQSCRDVPESLIVVDTQGRRAVPRDLVPSAPDGDNDGFACGGQLDSAPTQASTQRIQTLRNAVSLEFILTILPSIEAAAAYAEQRDWRRSGDRMDLAAGSCDLAHDAVTEIARLSAESVWDSVASHLGRACRGLWSTASALHSGNIDAATRSLENATTALQLATRLVPLF